MMSRVWPFGWQAFVLLLALAVFGVSYDVAVPTASASGITKFECWYGDMCQDKYCFFVIDGNEKRFHLCCTKGPGSRTACVATGKGESTCSMYDAKWKACDVCYQHALEAECPTGKNCPNKSKVTDADVNTCINSINAPR